MAREVLREQVRRGDDVGVRKEHERRVRRGDAGVARARAPGVRAGEVPEIRRRQPHLGEILRRPVV